MITDAQIAAINAARLALKEIAQATVAAGYRDKDDSMRYGMLNHAAVTADDALFDTLNHAKSYGITAIADDTLHNRVAA